MTQRSIPEEFIKLYTDDLLSFATKLPDTSFRAACLLRAEHVMDLVKAWRAHSQTPARETYYPPDAEIVEEVRRFVEDNRK